MTSRTEAQLAVAAGNVLVAGAPALKVTRLVGAGEPVRLLGPRARFVGRGGEKLDAALDELGVAVAGRRALDAGASTGGFTDCLLQRGVAHVAAVDVGHGQLHPKLRDDPRVAVFERTDIRRVTPELLGGQVDLVVADLSFISLRVVLGALLGAAAQGGDLVLLVKPQFEAGRVEAARAKGVIRDPAVHERIRGEVSEALLVAGAAPVAWTTSVLRGAEGNVELFVHAIAPGGAP